MSVPSKEILLHVIELACRAPSVHNSQPWLWRIADATTLELYADRSRQLADADPGGRNLSMSCGAAMHHAVEAARALGMTADVDLAPVASEPDFLARIRMGSGRPPADAAKRLEAIELRCTDRRRFTSWPIPESRLKTLAEAASGWGAHAIPITDVTARFRTELLLERARTIQAADARFAEEQVSWVQRSRVDGIPVENAVPPVTGRLPGRPNRFATETELPERRRTVESSDGLMGLCTAYDDQTAWLQAGEALSALWAHATRDGLSIVPLSQGIEVPETRLALRHDVFEDMAHPQLLIRVGWQEIARSTLPRTPRRPIHEVLLH